MDAATGVEPVFTDSKSAVLPLDDAAILTIHVCVLLRYQGSNLEHTVSETVALPVELYLIIGDPRGIRTPIS